MEVVAGEVVVVVVGVDSTFDCFHTESVELVATFLLDAAVVVVVVAWHSRECCNKAFVAVERVVAVLLLLWRLLLHRSSWRLSPCVSTRVVGIVRRLRHGDVCIERVSLKSSLHDDNVQDE